jgi:hypothetical protein
MRQIVVLKALTLEGIVYPSPSRRTQMVVSANRVGGNTSPVVVVALLVPYSMSQTTFRAS